MGWDTATLSWTVDDESVPGMWRYDYTFTVQRKAPSHVLLETAA